MVATLVTVLVCGSALRLARSAWHVWERVRMAEQRAMERQYLRLAAQHERTASIDARRATVAEREMTLKERMHADRPAAEPMPMDLERRCESWDEAFMQEQEKATLLALYSELHSWDEVRKRLAPLQPAMDNDVAAPEVWR